MMQLTLHELVISVHTSECFLMLSSNYLAHLVYEYDVSFVTPIL